MTSKQNRNLKDAILEQKGALPRKLKLIAEFVLQTPAEFIKMTSKEICVRLSTSEPTLIRFCRQFGHTGLSEFRIALALDLAERNDAGSFVPATEDRRMSNPAGKHRIACAARDLVENDRTLVLDNGSTLELFALELEGRGPFEIMTSGLAVAQNLLQDPAHSVILTGGTIERGTASLSGRMVEDVLSKLSFDTFVMSADSVDPETGFSTYSEAEAYITRAMVKAASRIIVLADHTKFRRPGLHRICGLNRVQAIVTDQELSADVAAKIAETGTRLVVAADIEHLKPSGENIKVVR